MSNGENLILLTTQGALNDLRDRLKSTLDEEDAQREAAMKLGRELRRDSTTAIRLAHQGKIAEAQALLAPLLAKAADLTCRELQFRFVRDQLQEYAEAALLLALLLDNPLPTPEDLNLSPAPWLLGLSDVIGEVRRTLMRLDPLTQAAEQARWLTVMDALWQVVSVFDHPDAILPIRSKQDQMRSIIEKTRSEVTLLGSQARLTALLQKNP